MKKFVPLTVLVVCTLALAAAAQNTQPDDIKGSSEWLEKDFGVKVKNVKVDYKMTGKKKTVRNEYVEVRMTLELEKDVENLKELREAFAPYGSGPPAPDKQPPQPKMYFYFFDKDGVTVMKHALTAVETEITGKKGDAFRVMVKSQPHAIMRSVKKIEVRPAEVPK